MAFDGEGTVYIPLEDFWTFVAKYAPDCEHGEIQYGVPRVNRGAGDMEISYAFSTTECSPTDWAKKPKAVTEWEEPAPASRQEESRP